MRVLKFLAEFSGFGLSSFDCTLLCLFQLLSQGPFVSAMKGRWYRNAFPTDKSAVIKYYAPLCYFIKPFTSSDSNVAHCF